MNDEQIERVAKALCAETCAHAGEPPCYSVEGDWPNPECDEPGCHTLAARAIAAMQPDAQAIREAIEKVDLRFQDIGTGYRPPMPVEALIRDLGLYAECMPSPHRAQNVMAMAAKLLRALLNKENADGS